MFYLIRGESSSLKGFGAFYARQPQADDCEWKDTAWIFADCKKSLVKYAKQILKCQSDIRIHSFKDEKNSNFAFVKGAIPDWNKLPEEWQGDIFAFYASSPKSNLWIPEVRNFIHSYNLHTLKQKNRPDSVDSPFFSYRIGDPQKLSGKCIVYFHNLGKGCEFPAFFFGATNSLLEEFADSCSKYDSEIGESYWRFKDAENKPNGNVHSGFPLGIFRPEKLDSLPAYFDVIELDPGSDVYSSQGRLIMVAKSYICRYHQQKKEEESINPIPVSVRGRSQCIETFIRKYLFLNSDISELNFRIPGWWFEHLVELDSSGLEARTKINGSRILQKQLEAILDENYELARRYVEEYGAFRENPFSNLREGAKETVRQLK